MDEQRSDDRDLCCLGVPVDCVGFVTGGGGAFLRHCEQEWATMMFFAEYHHNAHGGVAFAGAAKGNKKGEKGGRAPGPRFGKQSGYGALELPQDRTEERLAIFGRRRGQMASRLKVMSAIETKIPGYFTRNNRAVYLGGDGVQIIFDAEQNQ